MDIITTQLSPGDYFLLRKSKISEEIKLLKDFVQQYKSIPEMKNKIMDYFQSLREDLQDIESLVQHGEPFVSSSLNGTNLHHGQEITQIREPNAYFEATRNKESEMAMNTSMESSSSIKRRKLKSKVWEEFKKYVGEDGKEWAKCKHCKKKFVGSSKSGTTHLKNHLKSCQGLKTSGGVAQKEKEKSLMAPDLNGSSLIQRIIKYGLNSIKDDILFVYEQEKCELQGYLEKLPSCFSLRIEWLKIDYWYMRIYFVDDNWELRNKIIYLDDGDDFHEIMKSVLVDWNMHKKIWSMVSCYRELEEVAENLKNWFNKQGSLLFSGIFSEHISLQCIKVNLSLYRSSISTNKILVKASKLRDYVNRSSNDQKLKCAEEKALAMGKLVTSQSVPQARCDSEILLKWVVGYKEVFCELEHIDPYFKSVSFTKEDWNDASLLYSSWQVLEELKEEIDKHASSSSVCVSVVCDLFLRLYQLRKSDNSYIHNFVSCCEKDVAQYWKNFGLVLEVSVILDPRCKLEMVESYYKLFYGNDAKAHLRKTIDDVKNFLSNHVKGTSSFSSSYDYDSALKLELDKYLKEEHPQDEGFDIQQWWRDKSLVYPILGRVARDFLIIRVQQPILDSPLLDEIEDIFKCTTLDDDFKKKLACTKIWLNTSGNN